MEERRELDSYDSFAPAFVRRLFVSNEDFVKISFLFRYFYQPFGENLQRTFVWQTGREIQV